MVSRLLFLVMKSILLASFPQTECLFLCKFSLGLVERACLKLPWIRNAIVVSEIQLLTSHSCWRVKVECLCTIHLFHSRRRRCSMGSLSAVLVIMTISSLPCYSSPFPCLFLTQDVNELRDAGNCLVRPRRMWRPTRIWNLRVFGLSGSLRSLLNSNCQNILVDSSVRKRSHAF